MLAVFYYPCTNYQSYESKLKGPFANGTSAPTALHSFCNVKLRPLGWLSQKGPCSPCRSWLPHGARQAGMLPSQQALTAPSLENSSESKSKMLLAGTAGEIAQLCTSTRHWLDPFKEINVSSSIQPMGSLPRKVLPQDCPIAWLYLLQESC